MKKKTARKRPSKRSVDTPIVADVRRIRRQIMKEFGNDIGRLMEHIRRLDRARRGKPKGPGPRRSGR